MDQLTPTQLDLPFPSWREGQWECIEQATRIPANRSFIIEAPTGFGKSAVPAALSQLGYTVVVMVATRDLQQQYANSFPWAKIVWGKANYPCIQDEVVKNFTNLYGRQPTVEDCAVTVGRICTGCPYWSAVREARASRFRVINYHYAYWSSWWSEGADFVVCDEAHRIEETLREIVKITVSEQRRDYWGLPWFPNKVGSGQEVADPVTTWLCSAISALQHRLGQKTDLPEEIARIGRWIELAGSLVGQMASFPWEWYTVSGPSGLVIRPITVSNFAKRLTKSDSYKRTLLMSATIGDPDVMQATLGLGQYGAVSLPHPIPVEHRPVFFLASAPRFNIRSGAEEYIAQAALIDHIIEQHPGEKGLIHTSTWKHTQILGTLLHTDRLYIPSRDVPRTDQVKQFLLSPAGTVGISPSFWEGLDLRDELCRYVVVAKIPFPDLSDPVIKLLTYRCGGRAWYDNQAAIKVVQGIGRAVRHENDWATGYIVDGHWPRVARRAPKWFEVKEGEP